MNGFNKYERIIAIKEQSSGNESVGSMWLETKSFPKEVPVEEIIEWAKPCSGRLIITIDEDDAENVFSF